MKEEEIIFGEEINGTDLFGEAIIQEEEKKTEEVKAEKEKVEEKVEKEEVKEEVGITLFEGVDVVKEEDKQTEEKKEEKPVKEEKEKGDEDVDYDAVYKAFVATGEWEEVEIEGEDKTIDVATFKEIAKEQQKRKEDKIKEKVLNVLSKDEKDFLEHKKNGGNPLEFLKAQDFKQKAEKLDISTDQGKKSAIYSYYKNFIGWSDEKVQKHINRIEKELELTDEAEMAKEKIEEITKAEFEKVKKQTLDAAEARQKAEDVYKETVKTTLKGKNYDTKKINMVVRDFTDRDEKGYTEIDKKYLELRNNPEKADDLWNFLMDYENFTKKVSQKEVNKSELESFKKIKFNKPSKSKQFQSKEEQEENELILN